MKGQGVWNFRVLGAHRVTKMDCESDYLRSGVFEDPQLTMEQPQVPSIKGPQTRLPYLLQYEILEAQMKQPAW